MALFGGVFAGIGKGISAIHEQNFSSYASVRRLVNSDNTAAIENLNQLKNQGVDFDSVFQKMKGTDDEAKAFYNLLFASNPGKKQVVLRRNRCVTCIN